MLTCGDGEYLVNLPSAVVSGATGRACDSRSIITVDVMVSIITAAYNELAMNRLFLDSIRANTDGEWELIVIDNGSSDGTLEFFKNAGPEVTVIEAGARFSYPFCQNLGTAVAEGDVLAYFSNTILLSPHWDTHIREVLGRDGQEVISLGGSDRMATPEETRQRTRRWKRIKYPLLKLFGHGKGSLKLMARLMYGNWARYGEKEWERQGAALRQGFIGSAIVMTRRGYELAGEFDPTIQAGDFDLYFRTLHRHRNEGDLRPMAVMTGVVHHNYGRLSARKRLPHFVDAANLRSLEEKWGPSLTGRYMASLI